tara:strand:+ start:1353 stop:1742 length:390 start_codon:yes stop_codon:yes gene_type:complete
MSKQEEFSYREIDDFISKLEIPLNKDKESIWSEKFDSLVKEETQISPKESPVFQLYWQYGVAASIVIILATTFYLGSQNPNQEVAKASEINDISQQDLLADQTMIESLFIEDNEFDEWFEEEYVLSSVN